MDGWWPTRVITLVCRTGSILMVSGANNNELRVAFVAKIALAFYLLLVILTGRREASCQYWDAVRWVVFEKFTLYGMGG